MSELRGLAPEHKSQRYRVEWFDTLLEDYRIGFTDNLDLAIHCAVEQGGSVTVLRRWPAGTPDEFVESPDIDRRVDAQIDARQERAA